MLGALLMRGGLEGLWLLGELEGLRMLGGLEGLWVLVVLAQKLLSLKVICMPG